MIKAILFVMCLYSVTALSFEEIIVKPASPNGWQAGEVRADALVELNDNQPLFGDGSLMFATDTVTPGMDKADFELFWQQSIDQIDFPNRTLGNVTELSHAWYRDSASTTAAHFIPVIRLRFFDDAGTPLDPADDTVGSLVWEGVYNGINPANTNSWELADTINENFWVFVSSGPGTTGVIQNFNSSLNDWINNSPQGQPGDPVINLSANTFIIGLNAGVGSGWNNSFIGYIDSLRISFGAPDDFLYNFEPCDLLLANPDPDVIFDNSFECFRTF
ncbi:MAG: hypothetical protein L3J52_04455 [Proteobacteria bacterium]|nr:hypothetical protein [Pseudomonadota bacterium]